MSRNKKKSTAKDIIANIVIVILSFIAFIALCTMIAALKPHKRIYVTDPRSFTYAIKRGDYSSVVYDWRHNLAMEETVEKNGDYKEAYALATYYNDAFLYRVYSEKGYTDEEKRTLNEMQEAKANMGVLSDFADEFDGVFGLK